jgi:hypothetical protein
VSASLPERPNLGQLRRQAKELRDAAESRAASPGQLAEAFVAASVERRLREAATILAAHPGIAARSMYDAAVLGDAATVREMLAAGPSAGAAGARRRSSTWWR